LKEQDSEDLMDLQDGLNGFLRICLAVSLSIFEQKAGLWGFDGFAGWIDWILRDFLLFKRYKLFHFRFSNKKRDTEDLMEQDSEDWMNLQDGLNGFLRMYLAVSLSIFDFRFSTFS
jgi:hypothetical protein